MANTNKLFNGRNDVIKFVDDYSSMIIEAKRKIAEEELKPELTKTKTKRKKSPFALHEKLINEIKNDEKIIHEQIFKEYFFISYSIIFSKKII